MAYKFKHHGEWYERVTTARLGETRSCSDCAVYGRDSCKAISDAAAAASVNRCSNHPIGIYLKMDSLYEDLKQLKEVYDGNKEADCI
jgi:hypothetical protein